MSKRILVVGLLGVLVVSSLALAAELTIWQLAEDSYPGELKWVAPNEVYVSLQFPRGIASFDPSANWLRVWETIEAPGEFEVIHQRVFFAQPYVGELVWLNLDYGRMSYFSIPSPGSWPVKLLNGDPSMNTISIYYLDWGTGEVGSFAPIESGPADLVDLVPSTSFLVPDVQFIAQEVTLVTPEYYPADPTLVPAVAAVSSIIADPFTIWPLFDPNTPPLTFAQSTDGRIWIPDVIGGPLQALSPWDDTITLYDLPGAPWVIGLAPGDANEMCYLGAAAGDEYWLGVLEGATGDVSMWVLPGAVDPVNPVVIGDSIWFSDRGLSAVCRLTPSEGTLTRWVTGFDDGPLFIEPGLDGEIWISLERTGAIARLRVP